MKLRLPAQLGNNRSYNPPRSTHISGFIFYYCTWFPHPPKRGKRGSLCTPLLEEQSVLHCTFPPERERERRRVLWKAIRLSWHTCIARVNRPGTRRNASSAAGTAHHVCMSLFAGWKRTNKVRTAQFEPICMHQVKRKREIRSILWFSKDRLRCLCGTFRARATEMAPWMPHNGVLYGNILIFIYNMFPMGV